MCLGALGLDWVAARRYPTSRLERRIERVGIDFSGVAALVHFDRGPERLEEQLRLHPWPLNYVGWPVVQELVGEDLSRQEKLGIDLQAVRGTAKPGDNAGPGDIPLLVAEDCSHS